MKQKIFHRSLYLLYYPNILLQTGEVMNIAIDPVFEA